MNIFFFPGFISDPKGNFRSHEVLHIEIWTRKFPYIPYNLNDLIVLWLQGIRIPEVHLCHPLNHWINAILLFARPREVPQVYRIGSSRFKRILILFPGQLHGGENLTNRTEDASKIEGQLFQALYQNDWQQSCQTRAKTAPVGQPTGFYLLSLCDKIPSAIKNFVTSRDPSSWQTIMMQNLLGLVIYLYYFFFQNINDQTEMEEKVSPSPQDQQK